MKNSHLLIIGAGQYGMVAKEIAESMGCFDRIDFVDDVSEAAVGKICDIEKLVHEYYSAVVALGNPELRLKLINGLCEMGYNVPTLIHERAYVSPSAKISIGCFIEPMAVVHTGVVVETGCILSAGVILNHNSVVHEGCHINCGYVVKARAEIKACTRTGYNEVCDTVVEQMEPPMKQHGKMPVAV